MQLTYRGQSYVFDSNGVDGVETQEIGLFLGKSYNRKMFNFVQQHQPLQELRFLGQRYVR